MNLNDGIRWLINLALWLLGWLLEAVFWLQIILFFPAQRWLALRLGVSIEHPVRGFGPDVVASIQECFDRLCRSGRAPVWAETSGSTDLPKRMVYTQARIRQSRFLFFASFARLLSRMRVWRRSFFVFAAIRQDHSLTSLLIEDRNLPSRLVCVQAPFHVLTHPEVREAARRYGDTALRLWLLAISNPGMLYATNPSSLVSFFDLILADPMGSTRLCREWLGGRANIPAILRSVYKRVQSRGATARLQLAVEWAASDDAAAGGLDKLLDAINPGLEVVTCWDGGYVRPFLERLLEMLRATGARFVPMYSMSTETIETLPVFSGDSLSFVPVVPDTLVEFTHIGGKGTVLKPDALEVGREYSLVVSNPYGLIRYQTGDIFECAGRIFGVPDLRFKRRDGLSYSFTGEKLTGDQVGLAVERIRNKLGPGAPSFALFPKALPSPHYELIQIGGGALGPEPQRELMAQFERELSSINSEYGAKRASGRLAALEYRQVSLQLFAQTLTAHKASETWESQFKFLPLYLREFDGTV